MYMAFVLSVLLRFTAFDYPFGVFKVFYVLDIVQRNGISTIQMTNSEIGQLGPIKCSAVCYLECDYIWKRFKNGVYSTAMVGPNFTIHSATMDDSGSYICYEIHKNDTSRIGTTRAFNRS
jgi:hypothetical protein